MEPCIRTNRSMGFMNEPPAKLHPSIMFGAGMFLTPKFIEKNHITHVINCGSDNHVPSNIPTLLKGKYYCLNAIDSDSVNITSWYPKFEKTMDTFLRDESCKVVYVNCQAGINRSGFLTLLYCCLKFKYDYSHACKAALIQRPCALSNKTFDKQVKEYIKNHA